MSKATATATPTKTPPMEWSVETFRAFWNKPVAKADQIPPIFDEHIVGYWPFRARPVRGAAEYWAYIVAFLKLVPDLHVKVCEHAESGDFVFIRWEATGTGPDGPFTATGCDRVGVRDGIVFENRIISDAPIFRALTEAFDR